MRGLLADHWREAIGALTLVLVARIAITTLGGARVFSVVRVIVALAVANVIARFLSLGVTSHVTQYALELAPITLIVLYRQEVSRMLADLGQLVLPRGFSASAVDPGEIIGELVTAVTMMTSRGIGGTIAVERSMGLRDEAERGVKLDAVVTYDIILSIFEPRSPLHDGAIVIQDERISAARVFFPMTTNISVLRSRGSRHQSAVGITEGSDVIVLVVSEERRQVSLAMDGRLDPVSPDELKERLERLLSRKAVVRERQRPDHPTLG